METKHPNVLIRTKKVRELMKLENLAWIDPSNSQDKDGNGYIVFHFISSESNQNHYAEIIYYINDDECSASYIENFEDKKWFDTKYCDVIIGFNPVGKPKNNTKIETFDFFIYEDKQLNNISAITHRLKSILPVKDYDFQKKLMDKSEVDFLAIYKNLDLVHPNIKKEYPSLFKAKDWGLTA